MKYLFPIFFVLLLLKLSHTIQWSWWIVVIPLGMHFVGFACQRWRLHLWRMKNDAMYRIDYDLKKMERRAKNKE